MTDSTTIEKIILENLLTDSEYCRKALPFLTEEYFDSKIEKVIFGEINRFHSEHNTAPNKKILKIFLDDYTKFKQEEYELANELIESFSDTSENMDWLYQRTEKFCKDKSLFNAITTSIQIMDGSNTKFGKDAIPAILSEALAISFDKTIGHDYWSDIERRYDFYHAKLDRIPFHLDMFNKITFGGLPKKTLSAILAPTGVGKSLFLCDYSANALLQGYNVLYITLEMAEEKIAERIDCNIMDVKIQELQRMGKKDFDTKLERLKSKTKGQLVIKEYPTSSAHAGHFKALLDDLRIKKGFVPDIICVDYLNICASQRYKGGSNYNSYFAVKATAEELRGVAVEYNVAMITATQSNKDGMNNSDIDMTNTSESSGTPMTLDFYFAIIRTEELDELGQLMVKQLKSRFGDINYYKRFVIGVELSKFKLYNIDDPTADLVDVGKKDDKPSLSGGGMKQNFDALNFE